MKIEHTDGLIHFPRLLTRTEQELLLVEIRSVVARAPLYTPRMPKTGKAMTVRMTNCGDLGWITDQQNGYRYQAFHPTTKEPWPEIPKMLLELWEQYSSFDEKPEACLVNYYDPDAKMGLHQDRDENNLEAPVLSLSLGDTCIFRYGGQNRKDPTKSFKLESGDLVLLSGKSRLAYHGVDRILPGTSTLLKSQGRINLTLRKVSR